MTPLPIPLITPPDTIMNFVMVVKLNAAVAGGSLVGGTT